MHNGILISVIITCFNYEKYIASAIESVLPQLRSDFELIVVDDGSTDGSWNIISQYNVDRYKICNSGQRLACIFGLERSRGSFILFLDADDELKPKALEIISRQLDADTSKFQFSLSYINSEGELHGKKMRNIADFCAKDKLIQEVLRAGYYQTPPTSGNVIRRDVCALLYDSDYENAVDGVLLFAAPFFGKIISTSLELGNYRIHGDNLSGVGGKISHLNLEKEMERFDNRVRHLAKIAGSLGYATHALDTEKLYHFRERLFFFRSLKGERNAPFFVLKLARDTLAESYPLRSRLLLSLFFVSSIAMPVSMVRRLSKSRF